MCKPSDRSNVKRVPVKCLECCPVSMTLSHPVCCSTKHHPSGTGSCHRTTQVIIGGQAGARRGHGRGGAGGETGLEARGGQSNLQAAHSVLTLIPYWPPYPCVPAPTPAPGSTFPPHLPPLVMHIRTHSHAQAECVDGRTHNERAQASAGLFVL